MHKIYCEALSVAKTLFRKWTVRPPVQCLPTDISLINVQPAFLLLLTHKISFNLTNQFESPHYVWSRDNWGMASESWRRRRQAEGGCQFTGRWFRSIAIFKIIFIKKHIIREISLQLPSLDRLHDAISSTK